MPLWRTSRNVALALALGLSLAGCASKPKVASLQEGACVALGDGPEFEIAGRTRYDQDWIDDKIEAGVGACQWDRPKPRPAAMDAPAKVIAPVVIKPPKRLTLRDRLGRALHKEKRP